MEEKCSEEQPKRRVSKAVIYCSPEERALLRMANKGLKTLELSTGRFEDNTFIGEKSSHKLQKEIKLSDISERKSFQSSSTKRSIERACDKSQEKMLSAVSKLDEIGDILAQDVCRKNFEKKIEKNDPKDKEIEIPNHESEKVSSESRETSNSKSESETKLMFGDSILKKSPPLKRKNRRNSFTSGKKLDIPKENEKKIERKMSAVTENLLQKLKPHEDRKVITPTVTTMSGFCSLFLDHFRESSGPLGNGPGMV